MQEDSEGTKNKSSELLIDWKFTSIESNRIEIKLNFHDPVTVSKGEQADLVFIQLELSDL